MKSFILAIVLVVSPIWPLGENPLVGDPYIIVDTSIMELAVVDEGEIQAIYPVSIGTRFTPTPEGQHTVTVKAVEPYDRKRDIPGGDEDNPLGTRWIGFDAEGTDGRIYGLHGTNDPDSIGDAVTGGCVRLDNESVEDVFSVIPIGTKILIKSDGESFQNTAIKKGAIAP